MPETIYINLSDINKLQTDIMVYVEEWVHTQKTPIPQKEIIAHLKKAGTKDFTTVNAIHSLMRKGYLRKAYMISNKTYYVQLRRV